MYGTPLLSEILRNVDIAVVTEHWLPPEQLNFLESIDSNFRSFGRSDNRIPIDIEQRSHFRGCGGIAVLWRNHLKVTPLLSEGSDRVIVVAVQLHDKSFLYVIGALLPSTNRPLYEYQEALECVSDLFDRYSEQGQIIILGDLNAHISKKFGEKNHERANERGLILENFIHEKQLLSANSQDWSLGCDFTFVSYDGEHHSLIDHILVESSKCDLVASCETHDDHFLNVSDHLPVTIDYEAELCVTRTHTNAPRTVNWKKATFEEKTKYVSQLDERLSHLLNLRDSSINFDQLESIVKYIVATIREAANANLPIKRYRPFLKPYWNYGHVKELHNAMRQRRENWLKEGRPRGHNYESYKVYKESKREFRKSLDEARKTYEEKQMEELQEAAEIDIGTFYKAVRKKKCHKFASNELRIENEISRDSDTNRKAWAEHYKNLAKPGTQPHFDADFKEEVQRNIGQMYMNSFNNQNTICKKNIRFDELTKAIGDMKNGKAGGHDSIIVEHIRYGGTVLKKVLVILFNIIIDLEDYPKHFKKGIVITLFKGGKKDRLDMHNYRDITLTPVLQKIFEKIMYQRISKYCLKVGFPHKLQQGFRPQCGSITAAFTAKESICHFLERNSKVFAAFLDNAKAFNSVWINGLLVKVYRLGINGKFWRILHNSFADVTACVLYDGETSDAYPIEQGVGQGRTLSAWLFLAMIDDLAVRLEDSGLGLHVQSVHIPCVFLADDTLLLAASIRSLQMQLDIVHDYAKLWRLNYNSTKSSLMQFSNRKRPQSEPTTSCSLGNTAIGWVTSKVYAGITLCHNLKPDLQIASSCKKGRKAVNSLISVGIHQNGMNPLKSVRIIKSVVLPTILYGCELWADPTKSSSKELERTQSSRDVLLEHVVNTLKVSDYVKLDSLEEDEQYLFLLGSRMVMDIADSEWENCITGVAHCVEQMLFEVSTFLEA
ncbi:uncharacterized protein LOC117338930 [Pecten maximus]|uniref:uncharacterized protein LOC117338930 n=1 Tax=Pecten maximus TaxID=6579 RepID=UPI00145863A1|nr:uncharacterized protein LOC117338930 [Pecten maximus]